MESLKYYVGGNGAESIKYYPGEDGAVDAVDRDDVRMVWRGGEIGHDAFDVKPEPRYEDLTVLERDGEQVVRPENTRDYGKDRTEENIGMLEEIGSPLVDMYKKVVEEYPQLCVVKLINEDGDNAFFKEAVKDTTTGQIMPAIRFNFSHSDTYRLNLIDTLSSKNDDSTIKPGIRYTMKMLALRTGADWEKCARNKKMATSLAFLHEMGHAQDYIDNYLVPEYVGREGMSAGERMAGSVAAALDKLKTTKDEESALIMNRLNSSAERRYRVYRDMPYEEHADNFATDYMTEHYDDFFIVEERPSDLKEAAGAKAKEALKKFTSGEDRVRVQFGREVPMDEDFVYLMGLNAGNRIRVTPMYVPEKEPSPYDIREGDYGMHGYEESKIYDENGVYIAPQHAPKQVHAHERISGEGKAVTSVREGAPLYIHDSSEQEAARICERVVGLRYVPSRDPETGKIVNKVLFNDAYNRTFCVEHLSD